MKTLYRMNFTLEMNRPIVENDYISPGGYEINKKPFDFNDFRGNIDRNNPCILHCELRDFDPYSDENIVITEEDIKKGFSDFYVFTGEYDDPEINVKSVKEITFEMYDPKTDEISEITATENIIESANKALEY